MTPIPPSPPQSEAADAPASPGSGAGQALTAFLRGIERRGIVFADLLAGDTAAAEQAFAVALRHFRDHAVAQPFAHWPRLFWRTLLASPKLRGGAAHARWEPPFEGLGQIGSGPRAALLLRLVAGLTDADAAAALAVAAPTYRLALRRALPHHPDGTPDAEAWKGLDAAVQQVLRELPAERLAHLARLRQAAVQGRRPELIGPAPPPAPRAQGDDATRIRLRRWLWGGVAACALGLLATFLPLGWVAGEGDATIRVRPLGTASAPAARFDAALGLLTEPDFELLAQAPLPPPADDPAFYAWLAANESGSQIAGVDEGMRDPIEEPAARADEVAAQPESIDAP